MMDVVRTPILRFGWGITLALVVSAAPVLAQESPPAAAPPSAAVARHRQDPDQAPHLVKAHVAKKRASLVDLTLTVEKTSALGADQLIQPGKANDDQLLVGGTLTASAAPTRAIRAIRRRA